MVPTPPNIMPNGETPGYPFTKIYFKTLKPNSLKWRNPYKSLPVSNAPPKDMNVMSKDISSSNFEIRICFQIKKHAQKKPRTRKIP